VSRLAVVDRSRVRVIDIDRRNAVDVTAGGDTRLANRQPAWSPDGARLAWSAFDRRQADSPATLALATPEGSWRVDHPAVFPPFYLAWHPDGTAVASLSEGPIGLELTVTDVKSGASEIVHRGAPLFFAWSREGALAVHLGRGDEARLDVWGGDYDRAAFGALVPGAFSAPAVLPDGSVVAVVVHDDEDALVVVDRAGQVVRTVAHAEFGARFVVDAGGDWIASTSERGTPSALVVHHLPTDTMAFVDEQPPVLFAWSPDATTLLFARVAERGDFPVLEWCTWRDGEVRAHVRARTTTTFGREILPFHEQYARSHAWWSPAGDAFCYAAVDDYGNDAVWVVHLGEPAPERIVTGSHAVWSPA
jgi:hypothetical protein